MHWCPCAWKLVLKSMRVRSAEVQTTCASHGWRIWCPWGRLCAPLPCNFPHWDPLVAMFRTDFILIPASQSACTRQLQPPFITMIKFPGSRPSLAPLMAAVFPGNSAGFQASWPPKTSLRRPECKTQELSCVDTLSQQWFTTKNGC